MMLILCSTPCRMTSLGADCPIIVTRRGATICDKMSKGGDGLTGYGLDKANLPLSSAYLVKLLLKLCPITFHFTWVVKNGHIRPKALFRDTPFVRFRWCARCQVPAPGTWIFRCQVLCVRWHERWPSVGQFGLWQCFFGKFLKWSHWQNFWKASLQPLTLREGASLLNKLTFE